MMPAGEQSGKTTEGKSERIAGECDHIEQCRHMSEARASTMWTLGDPGCEQPENGIKRQPEWGRPVHATLPAMLSL